MSERFWTALARRLEPYVPGEQPQHERLLKLNTNESPYAPSPRVLEALRSVDGERLLRYPDPASTRLRSVVADYYGLEPGQVFVGNGSDEVLAHSFAALLGRPGPLLFPDISYSFYPVWCQLYGLEYQRVPLREDFRIAVEDYAADAPAVLLPNPNAPTGCLLSLAEVRQLLQAAPDRLLLLDEAYIDFGGESAVSLIDEFDNLLVVQTLSKSRALAGLRVGLALGQRGLIEALERVKDSFNSYPVDCLAQVAAAAAFEDDAYFRDCCRRVLHSREELTAGLRDLGFEVLPSAANFLFARHPQRSGKALFEELRREGIILRRWDKPRIDEFLRISIGTDAQMERLLGTLGEILEAPTAAA